MEITAAMVKSLRERTGLPLMDCKSALAESGGDVERAIEILRKRGAGKIEKMAGRETGQGRVACAVDAAKRCAGIVELRCESAPVARTEAFVELANQLARHAAAVDAPTPETILRQPFLDDGSRSLSDYMGEVVNRLRENVRIARVARLVGHAARYVHHDGQKGCIVAFNRECPAQLAAGVCMHVTASKPTATRREDVDPALVERERDIARASVTGKPPQIVEKIVQGKIDKWFSEIVLLEQPYVLDDKKSVGQALREASPELTVTGFVRYQVGE